MLVLFVVLNVVGIHAVPPTENILLAKVLHTVEKTLDFFTEDYAAINVDGLFGLRVGQGMSSDYFIN